MAAALSYLATRWGDAPSPVNRYVCRVCAPGFFPAAATQPLPGGAEHVGTRFKSFQLYVNRMLVYRDGRPLELCIEAWNGDDGWAIVELLWGKTKDGKLIVQDCACDPDRHAERLVFGDIKLQPQLWVPGGYQNV
jgi:hypothetical protein